MGTSPGAGRRRRRRVRIGRAAIDDVTMVEAVDAIVDLVARQKNYLVWRLRLTPQSAKKY